MIVSVDYAGKEVHQYKVLNTIFDEPPITRCLAWDTSSEAYRNLVLLKLEGLPERFESQIKPFLSFEHPNIAPILDSGIIDQTPYVVYPYYPAGTLRQRVQLSGSLPFEEIAVLAQHTAAALQYIHSRDKVFFGLNPGTLHRSESGDYILTDLGIYQLTTATGVYTSDVMPYLAPEVYLRVPYSHSVDVYSLGAVLYHTLLGEMPFKARSHVQFMEAHLNRPAPSLPESLHDLEEIVLRAMEKLAYLRQSSPLELTVELIETMLGKNAAEQARVNILSASPTPRSDTRRPGSRTYRPISGQATVRGDNPSQLYADALMLETQKPAEAAKLYKRIIEVHPQRAQGEVIKRLHRLEQEFGRERIPALMVEAREARSIGDWYNLRAVTHEVLSYDPSHEEARDLYELGHMIAAADAYYQSAYTAAQAGYSDSAILMLRELYEVLPEYDDPERMLVIEDQNAHYVQRRKTVPAHDAQILALAFANNNSYLVSGSTDKTVKLWHIPNWELANSIDDHNTWVCSTAFSPRADMLLAGTWEGLIKLWDVPTGDYIGVIAGLTSQVRAMDFAYHNPSIMATASGYFLTLWSMPQGRRSAVIRESDRRPVTGLAFVPGTSLLACGMNNGSVRIRDVEDPGVRTIFDIEAHEGPIYSVASTNDGNLIATASRDGLVKVHEVETGQLIAELDGHLGNTVHDVAFSNSGSVLASAGRDAAINLWRVSDGQLIKRLEGHHDEVRSITFSPDGRVLASGGADGYLKIWGVV